MALTFYEKTLISEFFLFKLWAKLTILKPISCRPVLHLVIPYKNCYLPYCLLQHGLAYKRRHCIDVLIHVVYMKRIVKTNDRYMSRKHRKVRLSPVLLSMDRNNKYRIIFMFVYFSLEDSSFSVEIKQLSVKCGM